MNKDIKMYIMISKNFFKIKEQYSFNFQILIYVKKKKFQSLDVGENL